MMNVNVETVLAALRRHDGPVTAPMLTDDMGLDRSATAAVSQVLASLYEGKRHDVTRRPVSAERKGRRARFEYFETVGVLSKEEQRADVESALSIPAEPPRPTLPLIDIKPAVTIEVLIENIADVVLKAVAARVNERLAEALAESIDVESLMERLMKRRRLPRVLIAGLLPSQAGMISQEFGDVFNMDFYATGDNLKRLKPKLANVDHFITFTSKIEHATEEVAKNAGVPIVRCSGGMSMLRDTLTRLYVEQGATA